MAGDAHKLQEHYKMFSGHFQREDLVSSSRREVRTGALPDDVEVCRICFGTESQLYSLKIYSVLLKAYETITELLLKNEDNLPSYLCSECVRRLVNCYRFRTTSLEARLSLLDIVKSNGYITLHLIQSVKRIPSPNSNRTDNCDQNDHDLESELVKRENLLFASGKNVQNELENVPADIKTENGIKQEVFNSEDAANERMVYLNDDVQICRICFAKECKLYSMKTYRVLYKAYETLTGLLLHNEDNLPSYLCSECVRRLLNCDQFRTTSLRAHLLLLDIVKTNGYITLDLIQSVKGIQSPTNSNKPDCYNQNRYDLESEFIEKEHILFGQSRQMRKNYGIKQEILDIEYTANECSSDNSKVVEDDIKIENEGVNRVNATGVSNVLSRVPQYSVISEIKIEVEENDETAEEFNNDAMKHEDIGEDSCQSDRRASETRREATLTATRETAASNDTAEVKPYSCNICNSAFVELRELSEHIRSHTVKKSLACDVCNKVFKRTSILTKHKKIHFSDKPLSCPVCSEVFYTKADLSSHVISHIDVTQFSCDICKMTFSSQGNLTSHMSVHSSEKPFSCDVCKKRFNTKRHLSDHLLTHTGIKPYSCDICNMAFYQQSNVISHRSVHFRDKPFSCDVCNKEFRHKRGLTTHMKIHSCEKPFSCKICNKPFRHKQGLTRHMTTHTGERPYSCEICHKTFQYKATQKRHMMIHSCEKFMCDVCNKTFNDKSNLTKHIRTHS